MWLKGILILGLFLTPISPDDLEQVDEAGSYEVTIRVDVNGQVIEQQTTIIITLPKTSLSEEEGIDAHDFSISKEDLKRGDAKQLIELAGAHAWHLESGNAVPIIHIDVNDYQVQTGMYHVTFTTQSGNAVTVFALVNNPLNFEHEVSYVFTNSFWGQYSQLEIAIGILVLMVMPVVILFGILMLIYIEVVRIKQTLFDKIRRK